MLRALAMVLMAATGMASFAQDANSPDGNLDVRSSVGDLHIGADADARKVGVPLYPGARVKSKDENSDQANLSVLTEAFGMKLIVANYYSNDDPAKVISFYRNKLRKYGKVLECRSEKHGGFSTHEDSKEGAGKELKCEENSGGPVTELKAGTENNQHIVAVEPGEGSKGSNFALVYVHTRGKMGDL